MRAIPIRTGRAALVNAPCSIPAALILVGW